MKYRVFNVVCVVLGLLMSFQLQAQLLRNNGEGTPKLVVGIIVENMRPDYIDRYWNKFGENGFKKIYSKGTVFSNFKMEQHIQSYSTGTATLFTGVYAATHGIIANSWYDRLTEKEVNCVEDDYYFTVGSDTKAGNTSPNKLMASTIGDNLKIFTMGKSKVFSVAMNDVSSIFSAGHAADAAYWFDEVTGRMVSSSFYLNTFPDWVRLFNSDGFANKYSYRNWVTLLPQEEYTESLEDEYILESGYYDKWNTFPHTISKYVNRAGSFKPLKTTPFANTIIGDFTSELLKSEDLGSDNYTDLLTVFFSSMDYMNNAFGPTSLEMEDTYLRLDQQIGSLIDLLENKYAKDDLVIYLTSNTSASYPVAYLKDEFNIAVGEFFPEKALALLTNVLNITYGEGKWIEQVSGQQIYLNHKLIDEKNIDQREMIEKASSFINQFEGVKIVIPAYELEKGGSGNNANAAVYNSFSKNRSGDFSYILEEGWQPGYKFQKVNYTDQTHIPLVFYGSRFQSKNVKARKTAIDLVPTLCDIIGIPVPDRCRGQIMEELTN